MMLTQEELERVSRLERECNNSETGYDGVEMTMSRHLTALMGVVLRNIRELERSEGFYNGETQMPPKMPVSHALGIAARNNVLLNISMMSVLFMKCPEFKFELNEFQNVLEMADLYLRLLSRLLPSSERIVSLRRDFMAFKKILFATDIQNRESNAPLFQLLSAADKMMSGGLSVAEEFYRLESDLRKVADMHKFVSKSLPPVKIDEQSMGGVRRIIRDVARESIRKLQDKEPRHRRLASQTREQQVEAVRKAIRERIKDKKPPSKGMLRSICRSIFMKWPNRGKEGYDGYPTFDALYNYCHAQHIDDSPA